MSVFKTIDDKAGFVVPDNLTTFEEKIEFVEAAREALRLEHNKRAKENLLSWQSWKLRVFTPCNTTISIKRNELVDGGKVTFDDGCVPASETIAPIKASVREQGIEHPIVATIAAELQK